jgi:diacylglycerol kinase (ATP)
LQVSEKTIAKYQNTVLIHNPVAGKLRRNGAESIQRVIAHLREEGIEARPIPTTAPGSATGIAQREIAGGADLIIAVGGDGTVNEVANGMVHSDVPLAILPGGTANCLAVELGLGTRLERAALRLRDCTPERIAVGRLRNALGERYFLLMAGAGLDATIVYHVRAGLKNVTGKLAYWMGGIKALTGSIPEFESSLGNKTHRTGFALASRVKNYGGDLSIATNASLLSDDFEVVLFSGGNPLRYWGYFLGVATGTLPRFPGVLLSRSRKLELNGTEDRRIYVQVDGEFAGHLPANVEIVDNALTLMIPADFRDRIAIGLTAPVAAATG